MRRPDRIHSFSAWMRMLLEDMLVIDAATLYPRLTRGGDLYSLEVVDGATIRPVIDEGGPLRCRRPRPISRSSRGCPPPTTPGRSCSIIPATF